MIPEREMYVIMAVLMAFVTIAFAVSVARVSDEKRLYYYPIAAIPAMVAAGFGLMSQGILWLEVGGTTMPAARLIGYEIMFPTMAVYIGLAGGLGWRRTGIVAGSMFLVVFGVILNWSPDPFNTIGSLLTLFALIGVAYLLLGPYDRQAREQSGELRLLYGKLRNLVLLMWVLYVVVGMSTRSGLGLLDVFTGIFMASYLDLVATVTFGAIVLGSADAMHQLIEEHEDDDEPPEPPADAADGADGAITGAAD